MAIYAYVADGIVIEIIQPLLDADGTECPIAQRFTPQFLLNLVDVTSVSPLPKPNWLYNGSVFSAP